MSHRHRNRGFGPLTCSKRGPELCRRARTIRRRTSSSQSLRPASVVGSRQHASGGLRWVEPFVHRTTRGGHHERSEGWCIAVDTKSLVLFALCSCIYNEPHPNERSTSRRFPIKPLKSTPSQNFPLLMAHAGRPGNFIINNVIIFHLVLKYV